MDCQTCIQIVYALPRECLDLCHLSFKQQRLSLVNFVFKNIYQKQAVFMWIFILYQQCSSFHWVIQEAILTPVPNCLCERVLFFMKDADPQQCTYLLGTMMNIFVNAWEGTCGFCVVNMGWKSYIPNANVTATRNRSNWVSVVRIVHNWIYSRMLPGYVEDESEHHILINLLIKFICSAPILAAAEVFNSWLWLYWNFSEVMCLHGKLCRGWIKVHCLGLYYSNWIFFVFMFFSGP